MSLDLKRLVICLVGWSMAAAGLLLSITVSVITAIVPPLQPQLSEGKFETLRRRIHHLPAADDQGKQDPTPNPPPAVESDTASADSTDSYSSARSEPSASGQGTSTPPSSPANSPKPPLQPLPPASPNPHGEPEQVSRHVCTPQKCSNTASTSKAAPAPSAPSAPSPSPPPAPQETPEKRIKTGISESEGGKRKHLRTMRAVSWLKGSPLPPSTSQSQGPSRSSTDSSLVPVCDSPSGATTFNEDSPVETPSRKGREPRRAKTLLSFKRFSKTPGRSGSDTASAISSGLAMTTMPNRVPEGRRSAPTSPSMVIVDLPGTASDAEVIVRERKRRMSYFARLKRKSKGGDKAPQQQEVPERDSTPISSRQSSDIRRSLSQSQPQSNPDERGRSRDKQAPASNRLCKKQRRHSTAPAPGEKPPRTNPYEAPYFFPTPVSPEAVGYVKRARTENRRTSISPGPGSRTPVPASQGPYERSSVQLKRASSTTVTSGSSPTTGPNFNLVKPPVTTPTTAPPQRTTFAVPPTVPPRATEFGARRASMSSGSRRNKSRSSRDKPPSGSYSSLTT